MTDAGSTSASHPGGRRWSRAVAWSCSALVALLMVVAATLLGPVLGDPTTGFVARKGRLTGVEVRAVGRQGSGTVSELRLVTDRGLVVDLTVRVPDGSDTPRPAVLILGGRRTGQNAARLCGDVGDVVVAALSYPFAGDPKPRGVQWMLSIPRIQRAVLDTVPAILLATDYLLEQPYVAGDRLELVGVSLGAFLVGPAAVLDERIHRVWFVHGAGDPAAVIDYALRSEIGIQPLRRMTAILINALVAGHYLAPERWIGRISPRPVIAVNARDDARMPRASVEVLHSALKEPYEVLWVDGPHVRPDRAETIESLSALILKRVSLQAPGHCLARTASCEKSGKSADRLIGERALRSTVRPVHQQVVERNAHREQVGEHADGIVLAPDEISEQQSTAGDAHDPEQAREGRSAVTSRGEHLHDPASGKQ
jgi:hypothetical protein